MDIKEEVLNKAESAKKASYGLLKADTKTKNLALIYIAEEIFKSSKEIFEANSKDIENGKLKNLSAAFIDRLTLNEARLAGMIKVINDVIALKDPVGEITQSWSRPNGMKLKKMRMPLGVIAIIFEARPNVCVEVAALTIKSGNAVILKGGSDALNSNIAIVKAIKNGITRAGIDAGVVEIVEATDREALGELLKLKDFIDVVIPRGGKSLVDFVAQNSRIPVIYHDAGICHTYVDEAADLKIAIKVSLNAKVQRPSTCNAMETLLVNRNIAAEFLPRMADEFKKAKVELRADTESRKMISWAKEATAQDFRTEYNDLILNIKIVASLDEAINHINTYGSHHSDAIITTDKKRAERFVAEVDSAACFINASTRLHDGNEFGLGAEMGISNQKLHVRGPMALKELTSEKYIVYGSGQIRE